MKIRIWVILLFLFQSMFTYANNDLENELSSVANKFIEDSGYVGLSIAAMQGTQELFNISFGHTDIDRTKRFTEKTAVALGSNMKVITASFILQLLEQRKLNLDAPVSRYLNNDINYGDKIRIRDLLCHTSGLPDIFGEGEFKSYNWKKAVSKKEMLSQINSSAVVAHPNEKYQYNNTGYLVLGWIVEDITGMSLGDYTREYFIKQLELKETYFLGDTFYIPKFSGGFKGKGGNIYVIPEDELMEYRVAGGAGAIGGTLRDYNKWFSLVAQGQMVTPETKILMQRPCILNSGKNAPEGLGIEWSEIAGEKALVGGGVANGFLSLSYYFPQYDLTIGFVGNTETDWIEFYKVYFSTVLNWYKSNSK